MPLIDDRLITFDAALGFDWRAYVDLAYKQAFFDIRAGTSRLISLDHPQGLIAFPSYHWTLSVLTVIAFWRVRIWFWPVLALNLAVILSSPVDGGHHLADALAGVLVAFLAWGMAEKLSTVVEGRLAVEAIA